MLFHAYHLYSSEIKLYHLNKIFETLLYTLKWSNKNLKRKLILKCYIIHFHNDKFSIETNFVDYILNQKFQISCFTLLYIQYIFKAWYF